MESPFVPIQQGFAVLGAMLVVFLMVSPWVTRNSPMHGLLLRAAALVLSAVVLSAARADLDAGGKTLLIDGTLIAGSLAASILILVHLFLVQRAGRASTPSTTRVDRTD